MPHLHTDTDQHDFTVTGYIVRTDGPKPKVLVHMHRRHNILLPIGGHVEWSETPWQAMAHELVEESGYVLEQLTVLQPKSRIKSMAKVVQHPYPLSMNTHYIPDNHFHSDIEYALVASGDPAQEVAEGESTDLRWLDRAELEALSETEVFATTKEVYRFILDEALDQWDRVAATDFGLDFPDSHRQ